MITTKYGVLRVNHGNLPSVSVGLAIPLQPDSLTVELFPDLGLDTRLAALSRQLIRAARPLLW